MRKCFLTTTIEWHSHRSLAWTPWKFATAEVLAASEVVAVTFSTFTVVSSQTSQRRSHWIYSNKTFTCKAGFPSPSTSWTSMETNQRCRNVAQAGVLKSQNSTGDNLRRSCKHPAAQLNLKSSTEEQPKYTSECHSANIHQPDTEAGNSKSKLSSSLLSCNELQRV